MRAPRLLRGVLCTLVVAGGWIPVPAGAIDGFGPPLPAPAPSEAVSVQRVMFPAIFDPRDLGDKVWGFLYRPTATPACTSSAMLLLHDVSYASHQWDLPHEPERYSTARALAAAGYPVVTIDFPGHGSTDGGDGFRMHVALYADITSQIVARLRSGDYVTFDGRPAPGFGSVGLVGAGVGTEVAELVAARDPAVAALVATGWTHFPSAEFLGDYARWDLPQTIGTPYAYFGGVPERRVKYMYDTSSADPSVVRKDTSLSQNSPSGIILTMMSQPSRAVMATIEIPVLLLLGENDYIFPSSHAETELGLFSGAADKTMTVVERAGHSLFLHRSAPETHAALMDWLRGRPEAIPAC